MVVGRIYLIIQNASLLDAEDQAEAAGALMAMAGVEENVVEAFSRMMQRKELLLFASKIILKMEEERLGKKNAKVRPEAERCDG